MAAGDKVQKGQEWKVEYNNFSYTGYMPTDWTHKENADDEVIPDERGATITHILTNPRREMSGTLLIKSTGDITPPDKGTWIELQGPDDAAATSYYVLDSSVAFATGITKLSLTLLLEDSQSDGASISPETADYDLTSPGDVTTTITFNSATTVVSVSDGSGTAMVEDTDWAVSGTTLTIDDTEYLAGKLTASGQSVTLTIAFDLGAPVELVISCIES